MQSESIISNTVSLNNLIYTVRGVKVMLDADLAVLYGYKTNAFNQQVKNNIDKFDSDFRFQLTKEEYQIIVNSKVSNGGNSDLMSKKLTSSWGGTRKLPYAFTEQGIYMLMTVLKGDLASRQSKALIRAFKEMKDYIADNRNCVTSKELMQLAMQTGQNTFAIAQIKDRMVTKDELAEIIQSLTEPKIRQEYLILNGEYVEANLAYKTIYNHAKKSIYIIDNYINLKTLVLLKDVSSGVSITIFSDNIGKGLHKIDYTDFCKSYPQINIELKRSGGIYHDRYIVSDYNTTEERIFHCGASSKDAGNKINTITGVSDLLIYHQIIDNLLKNPPLDL